MENIYSQIFKKYCISVKKLKEKRGGFNKNWIVYSDEGKYFLKRRPTSRRENALADCEISDHLINNGITTAIPLKIVKSDYLFSDDNYVYSLFEYIHGSFYRDELLPSVAKIMAEFQEKTKNYDGIIGMENNALEWTYSLSTNFENYDKYISKAEHELKEINLSKSLIHFDLHAGNMKFRGRKAIPFDFEYAHFDYKLIDVANSLICLSALDPNEIDYGNAETFIRPCKLNFQKSKIFISEFNKYSNIKDEIEALPACLNIAWLGWALYTLNNIKYCEKTIKNVGFFPKWVEENKEKILKVHKDVLHRL